MGLHESESRVFVPERYGRVRAEAINAVRDTIVHVPDGRLEELTSELDRSFQGPIGIRRALVVNELFRADSSKEYNFKLRVSGLSMAASNKLLKHRAVFELAETMAEYPQKYRMQLGILFSSVRLDQFPESIKEVMKIYQADADYGLRSSYGGWFLCKDLEPYMWDSIDGDKAVSVTDDNRALMLVQFREKMTGLCLETFESQKGKLFLEGNFYSPVGKKTRGVLRGAYTRGYDQVSLTEGSWAFMRPVKNNADRMISGESVLEHAKA